MIVSNSDVYSYLVDTQATSPDVIVDGNPHQLVVDLGQQLVKVSDLPGDYVYIQDTKAEYEVVRYRESDGSPYSAKHVFELPESFIGDVKKWILNNELVNHIRYLSKASREINQYYREVADGIDFTGARTDVEPVVYMLKDIDLLQQGKGPVVIRPYPVKDSDGPDVIKGYVYDRSSETVKYETVQAWRYRLVKNPDDLDVMVREALLEAGI